jgi:hypothetical protein
MWRVSATIRSAASALSTGGRCVISLSVDSAIRPARRSPVGEIEVSDRARSGSSTHGCDQQERRSAFSC